MCVFFQIFDLESDVGDIRFNRSNQCVGRQVLIHNRMLECSDMLNDQPSLFQRYVYNLIKCIQTVCECSVHSWLLLRSKGQKSM